MTRDELRDVLQVSLRAGQLLLESGANIARVEEAVHELGTGLGADWMEVYVTPSGIIATAVSHGETRTRILRVVHSGVQLSRVEAVIRLVKRAGQLNRMEITAALEAMEQQSRCYSPWFTALAVGLACSAFLVLFGGTVQEAAVVLVTATLAQMLRHLLMQLHVGRYVCTTLVASFACIVALVGSAHWGLSQLTVAASLLLLVPGVPLISGTADLFRGDTLAGMARAMSAFLTLIAGAVGVWAVILLSGQTVELQVSSLQHPGLTLLMGMVSAAGFAVLFDVPPVHLLGVAGVGAVATGTRWLALHNGIPAVASAFLAGLALGTVAQALAAVRRAPSSLYTIPGYIPLVPGAVALNSILHLVKENYVAGVSDLIRAGLILMAVALGQGIVRALLHSSRKANH
jgi:uncharacterized membrane protein YjjP (DUF1212 family)